MSKRKEKKSAPLADWEFHLQGPVDEIVVPVDAAAIRRHKDGSYSARDADGTLMFDAPPGRVIYAIEAGQMPSDPGPIEMAGAGAGAGR